MSKRDYVMIAQKVELSLLIGHKVSVVVKDNNIRGRDGYRGGRHAIDICFSEPPLGPILKNKNALG